MSSSEGEERTEALRGDDAEMFLKRGILDMIREEELLDAEDATEAELEAGRPKVGWRNETEIGIHREESLHTQLNGMGLAITNERMARDQKTKKVILAIEYRDLESWSA